VSVGCRSLILLSAMTGLTIAARPPATFPATKNPISAPLKALSTNPDHFTDGSGKVVYLTGSHTWNNVRDWGTDGFPQPFDFAAYVNMLVAQHHNFTLLWQTELPSFRGLPTTASTPPDFSVTPHPWLRTGPGKASHGKLKFDLTKFNPAYLTGCALVWTNSMRLVSTPGSIFSAVNLKLSPASNPRNWQRCAHDAVKVAFAHQVNQARKVKK
jgi:hypothetical protein